MNKFAKLFLVASLVSVLNSGTASAFGVDDFLINVHNFMMWPAESIQVTKIGNDDKPVEVLDASGAVVKEADGKTNKLEKTPLATRFPKIGIAVAVSTKAAIVAGVVAAAIAIKNKCKCAADKATEATN